MTKFLAALLILGVAFSSNAFAYRKGSHPSQDPNYSHDAYGHLSRTDNLNNDTDHDGVSNYYDRNDRDSSRTYY